MKLHEEKYFFKSPPQFNIYSHTEQQTFALLSLQIIRRYGIVTIQVQVQFQSPKSKGLGVTLFHHHLPTKTFLSNQTSN